MTLPRYSLAYFNHDGSIKETGGKAIHLVFQPGYENLRAGQILRVANIICLFRNTHGIMNIALSKNNKVIWDTTMTQFRTVGRIPYFLFTKKINEPGEYIYSSNAKIISNDRNTLIKGDHRKVVIHISK